MLRAQKLPRVILSYRVRNKTHFINACLVLVAWLRAQKFPRVISRIADEIKSILLILASYLSYRITIPFSLASSYTCPVLTAVVDTACVCVCAFVFRLGFARLWKREGSKALSRSPSFPSSWWDRKWRIHLLSILTMNICRFKLFGVKW